MGSTFISYRRKDWSFAQRLAERLEERITEGRVFIDIRIDEEEFEQVISREITQCDLFILVLTERTLDPVRIFNSDDWIRKEIAQALSQNKPIVLAMLEEIRPPKASELPEDIQGITKKQGIEFYPAFFDAALEKLLKHGKSIAPNAYDISASALPAAYKLPFVKRTNLGHHQVIHHLQNYDRISLCGYALDRFTQDAADTIRERLLVGSEIRLIIVNAGGVAHQLMVEYDSAPQGIHNVELTLSVLSDIASSVRRKGRTPNLEIRGIDWIPSCSLYICHHNTEMDTDWMQVEVYPPCFDTYPGNRPAFTMSRGSEPIWFDYFMDQFELLWSWSKKLDLN